VVDHNRWEPRFGKAGDSFRKAKEQLIAARSSPRNRRILADIEADPAAAVFRGLQARLRHLLRHADPTFLQDLERVLLALKTGELQPTTSLPISEILSPSASSASIHKPPHSPNEGCEKYAAFELLAVVTNENYENFEKLANHANIEHHEILEPHETRKANEREPVPAAWCAVLLLEDSYHRTLCHALATFHHLESVSETRPDGRRCTCVMVGKRHRAYLLQRAMRFSCEGRSAKFLGLGRSGSTSRLHTLSLVAYLASSSTRVIADSTSALHAEDRSGEQPATNRKEKRKTHDRDRERRLQAVQTRVDRGNESGGNASVERGESSQSIVDDIRRMLAGSVE